MLLIYADARGLERDINEVARIAKILAEKYRNETTELMSILEISKEQQEEYDTYQSDLKILYIVLEFAKKANTKKFEAKLTELMD